MAAYIHRSRVGAQEDTRPHFRKEMQRSSTRDDLRYAKKYCICSGSSTICFLNSAESAHSWFCLRLALLWARWKNGAKLTENSIRSAFSKASSSFSKRILKTNGLSTRSSGGTSTKFSHLSRAWSYLTSMQTSFRAEGCNKWQCRWHWTTRNRPIKAPRATQETPSQCRISLIIFGEGSEEIHYFVWPVS